MRIIALAIFIASSASWAVHAQDMPPSSTDTTNHSQQIALAKQAAISWLALVDQGSYSDSWTEAAALFKQALADSQWVAQLTGVRKPLGKVLSRELAGSSYTTLLPMAPKGEYVVLHFNTSFESAKNMFETVTPMVDPDGAWRVAGYYIKAK
jgi:Protein of unknown function (DUF4019)